jgi:myo-inositol catabolism protein IolC
MAGAYSKDKTYLILAFDHRGSFEKLLGVQGPKPTAEEIERLRKAKDLVYRGFKEAVARGLPRDKVAVLADEDYGSRVLEAAKRDGVAFATPVEKSGQDEFDFDKGDPGYQDQIKRLQPTFVKVLVRYNPAGDKESNQRQLQRLKRLNDHLQQTNQSFLFELLVPAVGDQKNDPNYDNGLRPKLTLQAIGEIQDAGIRPDLWKIEGLDARPDMEALVKTARAVNPNAGVIVLGRGESMEKVRNWISIAATVPGVLGFAVGRTIFSDAIKGYVAGDLSEDQAAAKIADNYETLVNLWTEASKQVASPA